jgi:DNA (cytosine-5)-methyltransferase 1
MINNGNKALSSGALFAGIGGFCTGFEAHEIKTAWAVENDCSAAATYSANFGPNKVVSKNCIPQSIKDVSVEGSKLNAVDILHAGFPCQSFSIAGERKGFEDPRGQLFYEIIRLVNEFEDNRPSVLLLENAPNFKKGDYGSWFKELSTKIKQAGYWFRESNAIELDSYDYTLVPQKRKRLFMIAFSTNRFKNGKINIDFPKINQRKSIKDFINFDGYLDDDGYYLNPNNKYYKMIMEKIDHPLSVVQLRKYEVRKKNLNTVPTLTANMGLGGHNVPFIKDKKGLRKMTEYECLRVQGFPDSFIFPDEVPRAKRYQQVGNSVVPPLISLLANVIKKKIENERL